MAQGAGRAVAEEVQYYHKVLLERCMEEGVFGKEVADKVLVERCMEVGVLGKEVAAERCGGNTGRLCPSREGWNNFQL